MRRVVFTSRSSREFKRQEVAALCRSSAERNEANRLTGLFLYDGIRFLQALEGEDQPLISTLDRIEQDSRHYDMTYISSVPIRSREFHDWTMSQPLFGIGDDAEVYLDRIKRDVANLSDPHLKAQFIGFAMLARTAKFRYE